MVVTNVKVYIDWVMAFADFVDFSDAAHHGKAVWICTQVIVVKVYTGNFFEFLYL